MEATFRWTDRAASLTKLEGMVAAEINDKLDMHGERAALRGNPSFVWRAGQERRLKMIMGDSVPCKMSRRTLVVIALAASLAWWVTRKV